MIFHFYLDFLLIIFFQSRSQRNIEQQCTNTSHTILYKNSFSPSSRTSCWSGRICAMPAKITGFPILQIPSLISCLPIPHISLSLTSRSIEYLPGPNITVMIYNCCLDETATGFPPRCIFVFLWSGNCCSVSNMVKYPASTLSSQYTTFRYLPFK